MTPRRIIGKALERGMDIIAVSDHNSAGNLLTASRSAQGKGITIIPGMEITSSEEAHVLALFGSVESALEMEKRIGAGLPLAGADDRFFGEQVLVNEEDEVLGFNKLNLLGATGMALKELVRNIRELGGLAVASHVDREAFSVISQLGFIPEDVRFDALEIINPRSAALYPDGTVFLRSSDAHQLEDVAKRSTGFLMERPSFEEIALAFTGADGRKIIRD
jgi:predicted metal-dependent phosphoesterase TrpH